MFFIDTLILVAGILLLLGIASSKLSARLGLPVLVLFLLLGMVAGSEGLGGLAFEDYQLAHGIGTLALALILFDGGLSTSLSSIRLAWKPSAVLATFGVLLTSVITGLAASWILKISLLEGLLLGSIVGSTDAAAVFAVLRSGGVRLPKRIASVLEVESASNDPMAIFLTIGCIQVLLGNMPLGPGLISLFAVQMVVGGVCGAVGGYLAGWLVNRIELGTAGMYPVLITASCLLTFGIAAQLGGSGFLAVYVAGIILGNRPLVFQRGILLFHDAVAWLAQIAMFVVLGLLCFPSRLMEVSGKALLISVVLILVARPISVVLSVIPFRFSWRELVFLSWVGLKGAVPITLATFPLMLATEENSLQAALIFDVVFFIVVISAVVQGVSLSPLARWLGLERPPEPEPPVTLEISSLRLVNGEVVDYVIKDGSRAAGRSVKELALPEGAVIALIARGDEVIPPHGNSQIAVGDHVVLVLQSGIQSLVSRVFAVESAETDPLPAALEFPLRATTTVAELSQLYSIPMDAPPASTLADVMREQLKGTGSPLGKTVRFGPIALRVIRLADDSRIEMVGMSILPEVVTNQELESGAE
jgi:cell volume regulation protein A